MYNGCIVSVRQKNFEAHWPFSFAQHRWAETESKRQESARCSLYTETVLAKTMRLSLLTAKNGILNGVIPSFVASRHV